MKALLVTVASAVAIGTATFSAADGFHLSAARKLTLSAATLAHDEKAATPGKIETNKRSISFREKMVRLVIKTGPDNDMLSFRLRGLRNPTVTVRAGAVVRVLFENTDGDMLHDFRLTSSKPPFANVVIRSDSVGSAALSHATGKRFFAQELGFSAPSGPGDYTYVCTMRGHAAGGMFGRFRVR